jgi:alpha-L-rhamnosidase
MRAWVDKMDAVAGDDLIWRGGNQYGDWLDPAAPPEAPDRAKADPDVVATAYFARSAQIVADAAHVLDRVNEAAYYGQLAERVRSAFASAFVTPAGRILSDAQTVYAIALEWGLLTDAARRRAAGSRLADLVRAGSFRIATGFVGTPVICDALMNAGYPDLAFRLLLQTECPSWLYPVTMGATTVWERWDSMLPDGSINPGEMTSFNHYALGSIVDWVHRRIAGLAPAEPGYRTISVRPVPPRELTRASARHRTPYGEASVSWQRYAGTLTLDVSVPVGSRAEVELPWGAGRASVGHGDHSWQIAEPSVRETSIVTVRDVFDDPALWKSFVDVAVECGLSASETSTALLLASHFDRPANELLDAVWTRTWPSKSAKARLADLLGAHLRNIEDAPTADLERSGV